MRPSRSRALLWITACLAVVLALFAPTPSRGGGFSIAVDELCKRIEGSIVRLDFDDARRDFEVARVVIDDPRVALERARLALYELDCDAAVAILARPEVKRVGDGEVLADTARGCQRVIASLATSMDPARGIEVHWQDDSDAPLAPLLFETVAQARESLSRHLGVDWPLPTRIVVVRDLLSLSAMTGLPYESARTTGTVAVAKWGRVTLLSPRATRHGFPWRDTVAHELTHLAVTRATGDRAPLWLQEGIAKREEVRWRAPGPFDDQPPADAVAQEGVERGLAVHLDQLGPSIAMLPTAEAARVAFAEVTSLVGFYLEHQGPEALPRLLQELGGGKDPDAALLASSGADFKTWDRRWRAFVTSRPQAPLQKLLAPAAGDRGRERSPVAALRELRDRARLTELLLARGHAAEALDEIVRIDPPAGGAGAGPVGGNGGAGAIAARDPADVRSAPLDPGIVWLHGRALEMQERTSELAPLVSAPDHVASSYGPWWALRGRWASARDDTAVALDSLSEGLAADPLDFEVACGTVDEGQLPALPASLSAAVDRALCDAARARGEPPFDGD